MTVKFHPNIANLMIGKGILAAGYNEPSGITIYSGTQPTAEEIATNWSLYNSTNSNFLAHYSGAVWTQPLDGAAKFCSITTFPPAVSPVNSGTGTWCIVWSSNPSLASLASSTIPNEVFIVGEVSSLAASGIVRFNPDNTFVSGTAKEISDGVITAGLAVI